MPCHAMSCAQAVIKLQYLVEWYMSREQRFKAVSRAEMEELVEEQVGDCP